MNRLGTTTSDTFLPDIHVCDLQLDDFIEVALRLGSKSKKLCIFLLQNKDSSNCFSTISASRPFRCYRDHVCIRAVHVSVVSI